MDEGKGVRKYDRQRQRLRQSKYHVQEFITYVLSLTQRKIPTIITLLFIMISIVLAAFVVGNHWQWYEHRHASSKH